MKSIEEQLDIIQRGADEILLEKELVDKLKEKRVKRIVQTILNGDNLEFDILDDDIAYRSREKGLVVSGA